MERYIFFPSDIERGVSYHNATHSSFVHCNYVIRWIIPFHRQSSYRRLDGPFCAVVVFLPRQMLFMRYECYKPAIASIFYGPVVSLFFIINRFGFKNDEFPSFSNHYQACIDFLSKVTTYCYFEPIHELFTIYSKLFYSTVLQHLS